MANQNFDQLAWDYLMDSPRDQSVLRNTLVNAGAPVIFPLLRAGLRTTQEFRPLDRSVMDQKSTDAESTWIYQIAEPMLKNIYTIVNAIGQPAYDALCNALWDQDERLKVLAAIVLLQEEQPSPRTVKQAKNTFNMLWENDQSKKYFKQSGIILILNHFLAHAGDSAHQQALRVGASQLNVSVEQAVVMSRNTGLLYLIR
jgi:hypothetical protein